MNPELEKDQQQIADCPAGAGRIAELKREEAVSWGYKLVGLTFHIGRRDEFEFVTGGEGG